MKVKDLIEKLSTFPANAQVLVKGYEDGFDSIKSVNESAVAKNPDAADFNGEYDNAETGGKDAIRAVVIMGNRR